MPRRKKSDARILGALYAESGAARFGVQQETFAATLREVAGKCGREETDVDFFRSLRLEELALARGCVAGDEGAWTEFLTRYRERLYDAARGIAREEASARELADGIYAELYGMREREGVRVSKLAGYLGRGSLEGWLRTVLAQEWVNRYRKVSRERSLEEQQEAGRQFAAPPAVVSAPGREEAAVTQAVDAALGGLQAEERLILAAHFLDGRTLAEVGRMIGLHESSVSRRVGKLVAGLRKQVRKELEAQGHDRPRAEEMMEMDVRDLSVDLRRGLGKDSAQEAAPPTFHPKEEPGP